MEYHQYWDKIMENNDELNSLLSAYWNDYSHFGTWQFWVVVVLLVSPLILLYFTVDRRRVFELFFYGYSVHVAWTYTVIILQRHNFLTHTYFLTPILPYALNMTASALPIGFLLVYQYCTNHNKNYYVYVALMSAVFAFVFATFEKQLGLLEFDNGMNQFHLFLLDIVIVYSAYWFTKFIKKVRDHSL